MEHPAAPRAGAGASLGSLQLLGDDLDPSPFSKGSTGVLWLFPSSQEMNHCKSSSLLLANLSVGAAGGVHFPELGAVASIPLIPASLQEPGAA